MAIKYFVLNITYKKPIFKMKVAVVNQNLVKMFLVFKLLLGFCVFGLSYARSEAEIRKYFISLGLECNTENPISPEDMTLLHDHEIPDNENAKCLLACVYKKAKWIDSKGMFDVDNVIAILEKEHMEDAVKLENSKKLMETCKTVNDKAVTDEEKGCQRSALLTTCFYENAPKLGVPIVV